MEDISTGYIIVRVLITFLFGGVYYAIGYWTGKNVWRKTGFDEGYLDALTRITNSNRKTKTQLRKPGKDH